MTQEDLKNLPKIVEKFKKSNYPVALTGAGISAESGIPTFRGESGLWKNFRPEELATPEAFRVHPEIVREWYNWRREIISKAKPNPGHYALAELERYNPNFTIITQNVDGLHLRAGSKKVIELHGNIFREKCSRCNRIYNEPVYETLAYCDCGGLLRPDVVWFGEPVTSINEAINVALQCDFMFVIGTSGIVCLLYTSPSPRD